MKPKKQVVAATMKDVALKANVSTATVSRALMNPDKVSQTTRKTETSGRLGKNFLDGAGLGKPQARQCF